MPKTLLPCRARYVFVRPDGSEAGSEEVEVSAGSAGCRIQTRIHTAWPEDIIASVDWDLDGDLVTRFLHIVSRERFAGEAELELTVTGNGLLAHRRAQDGPTQVELGWGPNAELDYVSAAFPTVMLARSGLEPGAARHVDAVQIGTVDLDPTIVALRLRELPAGDPRGAPSRSAPSMAPSSARVTPPMAPAPGHRAPEAGAETARRVECLVVETGHLATATATAGGVLLGYAGLLRLTSLDASK
jgi:hypothetical protein